jgi:hypothetical protein
MKKEEFKLISKNIKLILKKFKEYKEIETIKYINELISEFDETKTKETQLTTESISKTNQLPMNQALAELKQENNFSIPTDMMTKIMIFYEVHDTSINSLSKVDMSKSLIKSL